MRSNDFINLVAPIVVAENEKRGFPLFSSVVISQAACETGWGESSIMMRANAIFGIKATSDWTGKVYNSRTKECYDGVSYTDIAACFRAYDSLEQSVSDYFDLICGLSRYSGAIKTDSPLSCIQAIKDGGYATSPSYVTTIMSIISSNDLTRFDSAIESNPNQLPSNENPVLRYQRELNIQFGAGISEDGIFGAETKSHAILVRRGAKGNITRIIQEMLVNDGYKLDIDGDFGVKTEKAVKRFQKKHGLAVDGIVGPDTIEELLR